MEVLGVVAGVAVQVVVVIGEDGFPRPCGTLPTSAILYHNLMKLEDTKFQTFDAIPIAGRLTFLSPGRGDRRLAHSVSCGD